MELQRFVEFVDDPALGIGSTTVHAHNEAARELLGVEGGRPRVTDLFGEDPELADRYADLLHHYPDVGGVIEGGRRHFDSEHATVESVLWGGSFESTDADFGVFVDGDLRYFHARRSNVEATAGDAESLVVFREVTDLKDNERDLDFLRQVVSRILRHNLRNDLMVTSGYAADLEDHGDDEVARKSEEIRTVCEELVETARKARLIQAAVMADGTVSFDLQDVVARVVDAVATEHGGEFDAAVPSMRVEANPKFPDALEDTVENGVVYSDAPSPRVAVTAEREGSWVVLSVVDNGPGIPRDELDALTRRGETDLVHASGAGLWLTNTVVRESGGDITYDVDGGTTVRMRLPAAD